MALSKFTHGEWVPTGDMRFWRDGSVTRDWQMQYEWHRAVTEYLPNGHEETKIETEWRKVPMVQVNFDSRQRQLNNDGSRRR